MNRLQYILFALLPLLGVGESQAQIVGAQLVGRSNWVITALNETPMGAETHADLQSGPVFTAIDGESNTFYHSDWKSTGTPGKGCPQAFLVDMGNSRRLGGVDYQGRTDVGSGHTTKCRIYVYETLPACLPANLFTVTNKDVLLARTNVDLGTPVFDNYNSPWSYANNAAVKTAPFATPQTGRYILFVQDDCSDGENNKWFTCAEFNAYQMAYEQADYTLAVTGGAGGELVYNNTHYANGATVSGSFLYDDLSGTNVHGYTYTISVDETTRTITLAYTENVFTEAYSLVLENAPAGAFVQVARTREATQRYNAATTVYASVSNLGASDITVGGTTMRHAVLVDNLMRTISVVFDDEPSHYYVKVLGLDRPTDGCLIYNNRRYVEGEVFDVSPLVPDYATKSEAEIQTALRAAIAAGTLWGATVNSYTPVLTVEQAKIRLAYAVSGSADTATITYRVYYDNKYQTTIKATARIGDPYPHIDGTSDGTTGTYGEPQSASLLPYGMYVALYDKIGMVSATPRLVYDDYPSSRVQGSRTVEVHARYLYNFIQFYPEGTRYSKINQWYGAAIGANGADARAAGHTFRDGTTEGQNFYLYHRASTIELDTETPVLNENEYLALQGLEKGYGWAMVGNAFNFRLLNRAAGKDRYLRWHPAYQQKGNSITKGYFTFDSEGSRFAALYNLSVAGGTYGMATGVGNTSLGQTITGTVPTTYGASLVLLDEAGNAPVDTLALPHFLQLLYTQDAETHEYKLVVDSVRIDSLHTVRGNVFLSTLSQDDPKRMTYTVRVVVPDGASQPATAGGVYIAPAMRYNGNKVDLDDEPNVDALEPIEVSGYDALVSVDDYKRDIIVTYLSKTNLSHYYYVRNADQWKGYYMGYGTAAGAEVDPRSAARVRLVPAGYVTYSREGTLVHAPCYNLYMRSTQKSDGFFLGGVVSSEGTSARKRFILIGPNHQGIFPAAYVAPVKADTLYEMVDAEEIERGGMSVMAWDGSPYVATGNHLTPHPKTDASHDFGQWTFTPAQDPLAITVSCLMPADGGTTSTYAPGYVYWGTSRLRHGDKVYILAGDKEVVGLRVPVIDEGSAWRLYTSRLDVSARTFSCIWQPLNVVGSKDDLDQHLAAGENYFYLNNLTGHGLLVSNSALDVNRVMVGGAYAVAGTGVAMPGYCTPLSPAYPHNLWRISKDSEGRYTLQNVGTGMYIAEGEQGVPRFQNVAAPLSFLDFKDGTMSFVAQKGAAARIGINLTDSVSPVCQLPSADLSTQWVVLSSPRTTRYTVLSNLTDGGVELISTGRKYTLGEEIALVEPIDQAHLAATFRPIAVGGYTPTMTLEGTTLRVRYALAYSADTWYKAKPSYSTSMWYTYTSGLVKVNGVETPGAKFHTSTSPEGTEAPMYFQLRDGKSLSEVVADATKRVVYFGTKRYPTALSAGNQYSDATFGAYCKPFTLPADASTAYIYVEGKGYLCWKETTAWQKVGSATTVQFGFNEDVKYAERFVFVRGDKYLQSPEAFPTGNGFNFIYDSESFIFPLTSLGYVGRNPAGYVGQLMLGYNDLNAAPEYPLGLTPLVDMSRLDKTFEGGNDYGAVNRRYCYAFEISPRQPLTSYKVNISGLDGRDDEVVAYLDGVPLTPATPRVKGRDLVLRDLRVKPIDGYHYEAAMEDTIVTIAYTPCRRITSFGQLQPRRAFTVRSATGRGYLAFDSNWEFNATANANPTLTLFGSWEDDYRFMTYPADYTQDYMQWGAIAAGDSVGDRQDFYFGTLRHQVVSGSPTDAWAMGKDRLRSVRFERQSDGTFKIASQRYDTAGNPIRGSEYYLHAPQRGSNSYARVGDTNFTSNAAGLYAPVAGATGVGETNELATKWILEETEYEMVPPLYNVVLRGIYDEGELTAATPQVKIYYTRGTADTADDLLETSLVGTDFHAFTASLVVEREAGELRAEVVAPTGYVYDQRASTFEGRQITLVFKETFAHLLTRTKAIYKRGKRTKDEADPYAIGSTAAEDAHANIIYGFPTEALYAVLRTAICAAEHGTQDEATRHQALEEALATFLTQAKDMAHVNVPSEGEVVCVKNVGTGRHLFWNAHDAATGHTPHWTTGSGELAASYFYFQRDGSAPALLTAHYATGRGIPVRAHSAYATGHDEWLDPEGALLVETADSDYVISDPWEEDNDVYYWGTGKLGETLAEAPDYKYNYVTLEKQNYQPEWIYDIDVVGTPEGEKEAVVSIALADGRSFVTRQDGFLLTPAIGGLSLDNISFTPYGEASWHTPAEPHQYGACWWTYEITRQATATTHGLLTFTCHVPADYYLRKYTAETTAARAFLTSSSAPDNKEKGWGYPLATYNKKFSDALAEHETTCQAYATHAADFTYALYTVQKAKLDLAEKDYRDNSQVATPRAGDIVSIVGAVDGGSVYNMVERQDGRIALTDVDRSAGTPNLEVCARHRCYTNNDFWLLEPGPAAGVYLRTAYGDEGYIGALDDLTSVPMEWHFGRGTAFGYLSLFTRGATASTFGATTDQHTVIDVTSTVHNDTVSTDFIVQSALSRVHIVKATMPTNYKGAAPSVVVRSTERVALSPLRSGQFIVLPNADIDPYAPTLPRDVATTIHTVAAQGVAGYESTGRFVPSHVEGQDNPVDTIAFDYHESKSTAKARALDVLENLRYITALFTNAEYTTAKTAVNAATTAEEVLTAMRAFYEAPAARVVTLTNEGTSRNLGAVSGANRGGTYLGTSVENNTANTYRFVYRGDGSTPTFLIYNVGYGNYIGKTMGEGLRVNSTLEPALAGEYELTTFRQTYNHVTLTCTSGQIDEAYSVLTEKGVDDHYIVPAEDRTSIFQHWMVASNAEGQGLPTPGVFYYMAKKGGGIADISALPSMSGLKQLQSNGAAYYEGTHSLNNPAFMFSVARKGEDYVIECVGGGYLHADGTLSSTFSTLTAAEASGFLYKEIDHHTEAYNRLLSLYQKASRFPIEYEPGAANRLGYYKNGVPALTYARSGAPVLGSDLSLALCAKDTASIVLHGDHYGSGGSTVPFDDATVESTIRTLQRALDAIIINQPAEGFYRLRNVLTGHYLTMEDYQDETPLQMNLYDERPTDDNTLFYFEKPARYHLLGYSNGKYIQSTNRVAAAAYQDKASDFTLTRTHSENVGAYVLRTSNSALEENFQALGSQADFTQSLTLPCHTKDDPTKHNGWAPIDTCEWILEAADVIPVKIGEAGYATLCLPVSVEIPTVSGGTLAVCSGSAYNQGGTAPVIGTVSLAAFTDVLPAATPALLYSTDDAGQPLARDLSMVITTQAAAAPVANVLQGTYATTPQEMWLDRNAAYNKLYVLTKGRVNGTATVGFFGDYTGNLSGFHAFLPTGGTSGVKGYVFDFSHLLDGILTLRAPVSTEAIYSPTGQYLGTDLQRLPQGLYIVGGKAVRKK